MRLHIDVETYCDLNLKDVGLDLYSIHPSCEITLFSWAIDDEAPRLWDRSQNPDMPEQLLMLLLDDDVEVHAFNAQFERIILLRTLGIEINIRRWRCTMVHAYMLSFTGDLAEVGMQVGIDLDKQKLTDGKRLIQIFCKPQKVTKNQPLSRRDYLTDPEEWERFGEYCVQDVIAEREIHYFLDQPQFAVPAREWGFYALDQTINDRGIPIDRDFADKAYKMASRRKAILIQRMNDITGLINSNSGDQLLPWLKARGYPFDDLRKDTVKKVLAVHQARRDGDKLAKDEIVFELEDEAETILKMRQKSARTTHTKYLALLKAMGDDMRMRFILQFAGASRTNRFAGRRFQPQNLTSLHSLSDNPEVIEILNAVIRDEDDAFLAVLISEPLDALAGLVRSSVQATKGKVLRVCDLSSIESVTIGWVTGCERLLNVFREGKDAYKDFATELYNVVYEAVTKLMRKMAKPATLGAGFRLGGGDLYDGKKTGLWGYAEGMGVEMTRKEAHDNVRTFRRVYPEIPKAWYALEDAIMRTIRTKKATKACKTVFTIVESSRADKSKFLCAKLPSGRRIFYHKPLIKKRPFIWKDPKTGEKKKTIKDQITYMGKMQNGRKWVRIDSHGGKMIENIVQAIARDILREGLIAAHNAGFNVVMHVHDEIVVEEDLLDEEHSLERLKECMTQEIKWCSDMPIGAAGHSGQFYRKD